MSSTSAECPAHPACADLARFAAELQAPTLLAPQTLAEATQAAYPGLDGVVPGYGMQSLSSCDAFWMQNALNRARLTAFCIQNAVKRWDRCR